jgi:hypothetical protein
VTGDSRFRIVWLSRHALRLHGILLAGLTLCALASYLEWSRALEGHTIAWVYAFEWPLFAVLGTGMWWRLLRSETDKRRPQTRPDRRRRASSDVPPDDPELIAWQRYLERLHAHDPPGGPPS